MSLAKEKAAADASLTEQQSPGPENTAEAGNLPEENSKAAEGGGEASTEGKSIRESTQEIVSTENIKSITKDEVIFAQEDGSGVSSKDVNYADAKDVLVYEALPQMKVDAAAANEIVKLYRESGVDSRLFSNVMQIAYEYGYANLPKAALLSRTYHGDISTETMTRLYSLGQNARQAEDSRRAENPKSASGGKAQVYQLTETGEVKQLTGIKDVGKELLATERKSVGVKTAQFLQKIGVGGSYYFFKSYVDKEGNRVFVDRIGVVRSAPNGMYYSNGDIYIDLNAGGDASGLTLATLSHELTHFIQQWSSAKYKVLADFLAKHYAGQGISTYTAIKRKQAVLSEARGQTVPFQEAYHEFVADSMTTMFSDGKLYEKLLELKKTDKAVFQKIHSYIKKLAEKVRTYFGRETAPTLEGQFVQRQSRETIDRLQQMFAEALVEASENYAADGAYTKDMADEVQYSLSEQSAQANVTANYHNTVDQVLNMQNTRQDHVIIGYTPDVYRSLGMPSLPFVIGTGHIYSAAKTEAEAKQDGNYRKGVHYHGLGAGIVKNMYMLILIIELYKFKVK